MINQIYFIGFGAVATSLLEIFNLEKAFLNIPFTIIEPKNIHNDLFDKRKALHIKKAITKDNHKKLLKDIDDKTLVIDLSVEVDSIMILKVCKDKGSFYINTSVENWEEFYDDNHSDDLSTNYDEFKDNTLYHRELLVDQLLKNTKKTRIVNIGFNPGMIQEYCKLGLKEYAKLKNKHLVKGNYAKLGHDLGLKELLIVEYDSQKTDIKPKKNTFYNTWSCRGFESEAGDYSMLSLNNNDLEILKNIAIKPTDGLQDTHIRFLPIRGMDITKKCYTLDYDGNLFDYEGMLIPHAEIFSMSRFFQYNNQAPTIMYVYRPSDIALNSLDRFRDNNYQPLENYYVLQNKDIKPLGFDSIGALMKFENGDEYWAGSVCSIEDVRKFNFKYTQATTMQVAGTLWSAIVFIINNPNYGFNEPETIPSAEIFKHAKKYMGRSFFKKLN
jgi:homospermidine synthase